ncbi:MAG TPA: DUF418 domain-containing protein [Burkholderiaceae bacterium]
MNRALQGAGSRLHGPGAAPVTGRRIGLIDALRGFALGGILIVNLQSFLWGSGEPLGYFAHPPDAAEQGLFWLQAALVEGKFYPIFAFLFGVGFALQTRKLRRMCGADVLLAASAYRRRLAFLLLAGAAHGLLLYFGDILTSYALCGLLFFWTAPVRSRDLIAFARLWWALAALSLLAPMGLDALLPSGDPLEAIPLSALESRDIYAAAGYAAQLQRRGLDYAWQQFGGVATLWPQLMALFTLGAIAGRLGWLRDPGRHPRVWLWAWRIGAGVGLPCALLGGWLHLVAIRESPGDDAGVDGIVLGVSSLLAAAYVAAFARWHSRWQRIGPLRALLDGLAAAGRMPLTNYVLQSVVMGALFSGWGLGWGAAASRAGLTAWAAVIYLAQIGFSRWYLIRAQQGPLEALWRRYTYRGLAGAGSSSTRTQTPA